MNNNDNNTDLLIQYLDNELDDEARVVLEKKLASDDELKNQLKRLQLSRDAIRLYGLKQQVNVIGKAIAGQGTVQSSPDISKFRTITRWGLRVAAILILVIAGIGVYEYTTISSNNLYAELYQPYELGTSRSNESLDEVASAYKKKDYTSSIAAFQSQPEHSTADYFYVGQAYLAQNNFGEAVNNLQRALQSSQTTHQFVYESEFYLALAYLKSDDIEKARPLFEKIHADKDHLFHDQVSSWFMKKLYFLEKKSK